MRYADKIKKILSPSEKKIFRGLSTPQKIQDFLDAMPVNFEQSGETYMSPRRTIGARKAHCFEGALLAAAALAYHGQKPLLLDLRTIPEDEDHVVALFRMNGYWGAISKTNHAILRWRDPIYQSVREVAISYFHEYVWHKDGRKSLSAYSGPFDLAKFDLKQWLTAPQELDWLVEKLDSVRHFPLVPKKNVRRIRRASKFEMDTMLCPEEWQRPKKRHYK